MASGAEIHVKNVRKRKPPYDDHTGLGCPHCSQSAKQPGRCKSELVSSLLATWNLSKSGAGRGQVHGATSLYSLDQTVGVFSLD